MTTMRGARPRGQLVLEKAMMLREAQAAQTDFNGFGNVCGAWFATKNLPSELHDFR